jgi:hypothetical protein
MYRSFSSPSTQYSILPITVSTPTVSREDCASLLPRGAKITFSGAFSGGTSLSTLGLETTQPVITNKSEKASKVKSKNLLIVILLNCHPKNANERKCFKENRIAPIQELL